MRSNKVQEEPGVLDVARTTSSAACSGFFQPALVAVRRTVDQPVTWRVVVVEVAGADVRSAEISVVETLGSLSLNKLERLRGCAQPMRRGLSWPSWGRRARGSGLVSQRIGPGDAPAPLRAADAPLGARPPQSTRSRSSITSLLAARLKQPMRVGAGANTRRRCGSSSAAISSVIP